MYTFVDIILVEMSKFFVVLELSDVLLLSASFTLIYCETGTPRRRVLCTCRGRKTSSTSRDHYKLCFAIRGQ